MSMDGLNPRFRSQLDAFLADNPYGARLNSGFRSPERQAQLWQNALAKYGSPEAARKWVAPPGRSNHNHGIAGDLGYASDDARRWAHENAPRYGLRFPMKHEPWHVEPDDARSMRAQHSGHDHGGGMGAALGGKSGYGDIEREVLRIARAELGLPETAGRAEIDEAMGRLLDEGGGFGGFDDAAPAGGGGGLGGAAPASPAPTWKPVEPSPDEATPPFMTKLAAMFGAPA